MSLSPKEVIELRAETVNLAKFLELRARSALPFSNGAVERLARLALYLLGEPGPEPLPGPEFAPSDLAPPEDVLFEAARAAAETPEGERLAVRLAEAVVAYVDTRLGVGARP